MLSHSSAIIISNSGLIYVFTAECPPDLLTNLTVGGEWSWVGVRPQGSRLDTTVHRGVTHFSFVSWPLGLHNSNPFYWPQWPLWDGGWLQRLKRENKETKEWSPLRRQVFNFNSYLRTSCMILYPNGVYLPMTRKMIKPMIRRGEPLTTTPHANLMRGERSRVAQNRKFSNVHSLRWGIIACPGNVPSLW